MKVIINTDYGGFGLSKKAFDMYRERAGIDTIDRTKCHEEYRDDPIMLSIVEELGEDANDSLSDLKIVEIPDEYDYSISEYDGWESVVLLINEAHLRELIRLGNEDDIVDYVKKTQQTIDYIEEDEE